ncbi:23S rRNA (uracil(1939)-C(5))-methyltransferase RlmD [Hugenholtzia roseola]|uniref:23S rRNA (uracil(1939)-C(5))-methyltransferase RlmD n=1 Tax=Hugenholtzia roseola TaxID=1002 RepID=UPI000411D00B|nr:23S rRNA (uracil(1939)-C(5))-methyltransferase RlmD [Hugenholtzia roseola]
MARRKKDKHPILEKVRIEDAGAEGKCVARPEAAKGKVVFANFVVPDDVVDLQVTKERRSYMEARPLTIHAFSPKRDTPFCEHFGVCGGCKWQNMQYEWQLFYKQKQVHDSLTRLAKIELPPFETILSAPATSHYRNKMDFTFSDRRWLTEAQIRSGETFDSLALGFHIIGRFDKVVDIENCYLQPEPSNTIRKAVRAFSAAEKIDYYNLFSHEGYLRNLMIRTSATTPDVMVLVQFAKPDKVIIEKMMQFLAKEFPQISSLLYVVNPKLNDTFHDLEVKTYRGLPYIREVMEGLEFRIQAKSFYQTNSIQAYQLYKVARQMADLKGDEIVYDLYTGTGTIANFVAKKAKKVVGIEYIEAAIADAKVNSQVNGIENTVFFAGDMKDLLKAELFEKEGRPDVIITDPPRAGMHESVIHTLLEVAAKRIVYVSCNPATQARDLQLLDARYRVTAVQPVDMFPQTHHVENVVCLELK